MISTIFDKFGENAKPCPACGSSWIEEKFDEKTKEYSIICLYCNTESEPTLIQNAAVPSWNSSYEEVNSEEIKFLEKEIEILEDDIRRNRATIEDLEWEIEESETEIKLHLNEIKKLKGEL